MISASRTAVCQALLVVAAGLGVTRAAAQLPAPAVSAREALHMGGYAAVTVRADTGKAVLNEAVAALLVSGTPWSRLSYFAELEAADVSRETWTGREDQRWLEVERLYGEFSLGDALRLRAGKFLTPMGQWNEDHAAPLTWTASRPLTSYRPFAKSLVGVMAAGQLALRGHDAGYALYWAPSSAAGHGEETAFLSALGGRAALELAPDLVVGVSAASARASRPEDDEGEQEGPEQPELARIAETRDEDDRSHALLGADLSWRLHGVRLRAEGIALLADDSTRQRGAFAQVVVPAPGRFFLVARGELFDPVAGAPLRMLTGGISWRPVSGLNLKVERQQTNRRTTPVASGWLVSASALF